MSEHIIHGIKHMLIHFLPSLPHISGREEADPLDFPDDFYAIPEHRMVPFCREHFNLIINGMGLPTATSETIYSRHDHFRHYQMGISSLEESNLGVFPLNGMTVVGIAP